jgi:hypothetical protein
VLIRLAESTSAFVTPVGIDGRWSLVDRQPSGASLSKCCQSSGTRLIRPCPTLLLLWRLFRFGLWLWFWLKSGDLVLVGSCQNNARWRWLFSRLDKNQTSCLPGH